jgi:hypothetical protein
LAEDTPSDDGGEKHLITGMKGLLYFLRKGKLGFPLCLSMDEKDCESLDKSIQGEVNFMVTNTGTLLAPARTAEIILTAPKVKAVSVLYLVLAAINKPAAENTVGALAKFGMANVGVQEASVTLIAKSDSLSLVVEGSPSFDMDDTCDEKDDSFRCTLNKVIESVSYKQESTLSLVEVQTKTSIFFAETVYSSTFKAKASELWIETKFPSQRPYTMGYTVGIEFCVTDGCTLDTTDTANMPLAVSGTMAVGLNGPLISLGGELRMANTWFSAFGVEKLHVKNLKLGASITLAPPAPPIPESVKAGGTVYLGSKKNCVKLMDTGEGNCVGESK